MNYLLMRNAVLVVLSGLFITVHAMSEDDAGAAQQMKVLVVRPATLEDLPAVLDVDREVSFEHFEPLMTQHYPQIYGSKTVREGLLADLKTDAQIFERCVTEQGDKRLHVAYDTARKCVTGFVLSSKKDRVVNIDLLFVAQAYRRNGAAKKLFTEAIQTFTEVDQCYFYALNKNETVLRCIQKLGVECIPVSPDQKTDSGAPAELYKHYSVNIAAVLAMLRDNK